MIVVKLVPATTAWTLKFESVVILDSGKTALHDIRKGGEFESVVILDSGKTLADSLTRSTLFESVAILDSGKTMVSIYVICARV